ncbi:hypothetical protein [Halomarina litorea]|uniref:hypothetical protein n=1 Tax=Halomarina litorea TaxID=2961595 RepID=UPI0020C291A1|nr:hypothetical protein [Halomarina sp. BCD28]
MGEAVEVDEEVVVHRGVAVDVPPEVGRAALTELPDDDDVDVPVDDEVDVARRVPSFDDVAVPGEPLFRLSARFRATRVWSVMGT